MTTSIPTIGADGSLRLVLQRQRMVLSRQQVRILALLWQTAGKQLPSAGVYALVSQVPFPAARPPPLTQSQRASVDLSVRRLHKAGFVWQPRPQWLGLTAAGGHLMRVLTHDWAEWEDYRRRFLEGD
jgi:hypothetical protein